MAEATEHFYRDKLKNKQLEGLVIVPDGTTGNTEFIEVLTASHPYPDKRGLAATHRIIQWVSHLNTSDLVLVLLSGGASSLLCAPTGKVSLEEKRAVTKALFNVGASILELNTV